jgi:hypothetical protein
MYFILLRKEIVCLNSKNLMKVVSKCKFKNKRTKKKKQVEKEI